MDPLSLEWFGALGAIIAIDLVLAGDNAVVIALAANSLPKHMQRRAVVVGTFVAIAVRIVAAAFAVVLLRIPGVSAGGGVLLFWIAYKLVSNKDAHERHDHRKATTFAQAMAMIVVADAVMGIDNIIAIAGAAKGDIVLVAIGLVVSIPIVMWGSFFIMSFIKRHPWIVWAGGALLGWIGGGMITSDTWLSAYFDGRTAVEYALKGLPAAAMFTFGWWIHRRLPTAQA